MLHQVLLTSCNRVRLSCTHLPQAQSPLPQSLGFHFNFLSLSAAFPNGGPFLTRSLGMWYLRLKAPQDPSSDKKAVQFKFLRFREGEAIKAGEHHWEIGANNRVLHLG